MGISRLTNDPGMVMASQRITAALLSVIEDLYPRSCSHEENWSECADPTCLYDETTPHRDFNLDDWVVVAMMNPRDKTVLGEIEVRHEVSMTSYAVSGLLSEVVG